MRTRTMTAAAIIAGLSGTALGQAADWNNIGGGIWTDASNWNPMVAPNGASFDVTLGLTGAYTVDLNASRTIGSLTILNPLAILDIQGSDTLTMDAGPIFNDGTIIVNGPGSNFDSRILFTGTTSITGAGEIVLGSMPETGNNADARLDAHDLFTVTIGADQTIRGNGEIRGIGTYANSGTIRAEDPLGPGINIASIIDQTGGGTIDAANGIITLSNGAHIIDSELTGSGTGVVRVPGSPALLNDVTINVPVEILGGSDQLAMLGPVVNNSTITLNPNLAVFNSTLRFDADTSITGTGTIVMQTAGNQNDANITASTGFTGTIGAGQTVTGRGQINGDMILEGSITATGDGTVDMAVFDTITGSGTLAAQDDARLGFNTANLSGLTFASSGNGIVAALNGETFIDDIHITGNAGGAGNNTRLSMLGDITNDGTITLNFTDTVFNAVLDFENTASILGTGDIRMITSGNTGDAQIVTSDPAVGTFSAGQTVAGSGQISGTFVNNGIIDADDPTQNLQLTGTIDGPGALASNGGLMGFQNVDVSDHTLATSGGGLITATGGVSSVTNVVNNGDLGLNGNNTRIIVNGTFTNNANVLLNVTDTVFNAVLELNTETTVGGTGTIDLETSGNLADARLQATSGVAATLGSGQSVAGSGILDGDLTILGSVDPGGDLREFNAQGGTLTLSGDSTFDLGGLLGAEYDRISTNASQIVNLSGDATINLDASYSPSFGDEWEIIGGSASTVINGTFDTTTMPAAPATLAYRVFYDADRVYVRLTCAADLTGDAMQNFFDISTFIALFNAGDLRADLSAPFGALNFFDIAAYITIYNAGCN